eukprot:COSAG04_NODE_29792_length_266_cov_1.239521_1_plen_24_part_10
MWGVSPRLQREHTRWGPGAQQVAA